MIRADYNVIIISDCWQKKKKKKDARRARCGFCSDLRPKGKSFNFSPAPGIHPILPQNPNLQIIWNSAHSWVVFLFLPKVVNNPAKSSQLLCFLFHICSNCLFWINWQRWFQTSLKKTISKINLTFDRTHACDFHNGKGRVNREEKSMGGSFWPLALESQIPWGPPSSLPRDRLLIC